jgi:hypothetical protein
LDAQDRQKWYRFDRTINYELCEPPLPQIKSTDLSSGCLIFLREGDTIVRILKHTNRITTIQRRDSNIFIGDTAGNITFLYFFQILEDMSFEEWTVEEVAELMTVIGSPTATPHHPGRPNRR